MPILRLLLWAVEGIRNMLLSALKQPENNKPTTTTQTKDKRSTVIKHNNNKMMSLEELLDYIADRLEDGESNPGTEELDEQAFLRKSELHMFILTDDMDDDVCDRVADRLNSLEAIVVARFTMFLQHTTLTLDEAGKIELKPRILQ